MNTILEILLEDIKDAVFSDWGKAEEPVTPYSVFKHFDDYFRDMRKHMLKNTELFNGRIYTIIDNPDAIGRGEVKDLFEFAQTLFQPSRHIDTDLARMLYSSLVKYARKNNNIDLLIKCLYWKGLALMSIDKKLFFDEIYASFKEAADYRLKYKEIANFETRKYINRSLGNLFVINLEKRHSEGVKPFMEAVETARNFWEDRDIRAFDPDMPFDQFLYSIHQNTCVLLDVLRLTNNKELAKRVYESSLAVAGGEKSFFKQTQAGVYPSRVIYTGICAEYHAGLISARQAGEGLLSLARTANLNDFTLDTALKVMHIPVAAIEYLSFDSGYSKADLKQITEEVKKNALDYCARLPCGITQFNLNFMMYTFVQGMSNVLSKDEFLNLVLSMTTYRHMPTYVHSLIVSRLAEVICKYMLEKNPSYFAGVKGYTKQEIPEKGAQLIDFIRMAGMTHDVGKIKYINLIANYGRKISDYERAVIHKHSEEGGILLKNSECEDLAEVALFHHIWYDGKGGYPSLGRTGSLWPVIDIISVCDSISAATDRLGRPYKDCLSREDIIHEIISLAGIRYSPVIAQALQDKSLIEKISAVLNEDRREAYFTAYTKIAR